MIDVLDLTLPQLRARAADLRARRHQAVEELLTGIEALRTERLGHVMPRVRPIMIRIVDFDCDLEIVEGLADEWKD